MEVEDEVAAKLEDLGYKIFYRNLYINYNGNNLCEFDIVLSNCIIEVKSGKNVMQKSKGFNLILTHNILPENFAYYVYCTSKTDQEIDELQMEYGKPNMFFINNLADLLRQHPPETLNCIIESHSMIARFLNLPLQSNLKFNKIYINQDTYNKIYNQLHNVRDSYSAEDGIKWSDKLEMLVSTHRLVICDTYPESAICLRKLPYENIYNNKITLRELKPIKIPICYNITGMPRCKDMEDIYLTVSPPPAPPPQLIKEYKDIQLH